MRHKDKHKTVFLQLLWLEKIRTSRTYMRKSRYAKHILVYRDMTVGIQLENII